MLTNPSSILPGLLLTLATVLALCVGAGTIPASQMVRDVSYPVAIALAWHAIMSDVDYIVDRVGRALMMAEALRHSKALQYVAKNVDKPKYIMVGNAGVDREALREIVKNAEGDTLLPERQYKQNQLSIRNAHDALINVGAVEAARGNRGPRIRDRRTWDLIVGRI